MTETILSFAGEGCGIILVMMTLIQIAPIKINPWSFIARKIGKAMNSEVIAKVNQLSIDLKDLRDVCDEREADNCRMRILQFNDEIIHDIKHTKEHFDHTLIDISNYENHCATHPEYRNNIATDAIERIKRTYRKCGDEGSFL